MLPFFYANDHQLRMPFQGLATFLIDFHLHRSNRDSFSMNQELDSLLESQQRLFKKEFTMILTRIVSNDEYAHLQVTSELLKKFQILLWQDSATNEILKAFSHEGKICPVIEAWRKILSR